MILTRLVWHKIGDGSKTYSEDRMLSKSEFDFYRSKVNKVFGDLKLVLVEIYKGKE